MIRAINRAGKLDVCIYYTWSESCVSPAISSHSEKKILTRAVRVYADNAVMPHYTDREDSLQENFMSVV